MPGAVNGNPNPAEPLARGFERCASEPLRKGGGSQSAAAGAGVVSGFPRTTPSRAEGVGAKLRLPLVGRSWRNVGLTLTFPPVILRERLGILSLSLVYFEWCFGTLYG